VLLDPCAAALNQKNHHDYKKHTANNANDGDVIHETPLSFDDTFQSVPAGAKDGNATPKLCDCMTGDFGARRPVNLMQLRGAAKTPPHTVLLDPCAAALNQKNQHDYKEHAANNANDGDTVHSNPPFFID
jgi:hypothetical protein